ncbi:sporulation histidine kinase inhibitor Sda [Alteribacillus sp. YIM 98480]|nr:sporulation histidine kinase inhibitor Sda [Alteribacillus sp. YIM 98480]
MELEEVSTTVLSESYEKAKELDLDEDFINLLKEALDAQFVHQ